MAQKYYDSTPDPRSDPPATRRRPQFNMLGMMIVMLVCSVAFAGMYYMIKAEQNDASARLTGILFLLAGPMLLMVVVSALVAWFYRA
jgi:uncharacterized membrane protein